MKKTFLTLIFSITLSLPIFCQCNIDDIFSLRHNMTKFETINNLNLRNNIYKLEDRMNHWESFEYMENDSIYSSQVNFKIRSNNCVQSQDNVVILMFADHKLYKMALKVWFKPDEFSSCLENYKLVLNSLEKNFPVAEKFITRDDKSGEQTGEGYWLYKTEEMKKKMKFQNITIGYSFKYEITYDEYNKKWEKTGKIDSYLLELVFTDLRETKLDQRGY